MIITLLATARGIPQLYYGSEIAMTGDKSKGDGDIRRDSLVAGQAMRRTLLVLRGVRLLRKSITILRLNSSIGVRTKL